MLTICLVCFKIKSLLLLKGKIMVNFMKKFIICLTNTNLYNFSIIPQNSYN